MCNYILNQRTNRVHTEYCHYTNMILQENKVNLGDNIPQGHIPCTCCKPDTQKVII